jgi:hypothetical protein
LAYGSGVNPYAQQHVRFGPGVTAGDENPLFVGLLSPGPTMEGLGIWDGGGGGTHGMAAICEAGGCPGGEADGMMAAGEPSRVDEPSRVLPEVSLIGTPDVIDRERGGCAVWKQPTLWKRHCYYLVRVIVADDQLWCEQPRWHTCHVTCWFYLQPKTSAVKSASKLSPNIGLDPLTKYLWVRSNSLDVCLSLAVWVKRGRRLTSKGFQEAFDEGLTMGNGPGWRTRMINELMSR